MLQSRLLLPRCTHTSPVSTFHALRTYATILNPPKTSADLSKPPPQPSESLATTSSAHRRRDASNIVMRTYKPRTPGIRHLKRPINDHLWKGKPIHALTFAKIGHGKGGRNHTGKICVRHRGGGARRRVRTVDFKRMEPGEFVVERIEYDPNRSAHLALLRRKGYREGMLNGGLPIDVNAPPVRARSDEPIRGRKPEIVTTTKAGFSYIIAAEGMRAGDVVQSYRAGIPADLLKSMGGVLDPGMLAAKTAFRGNCLPLHLVPLGTQVYNVGSAKWKGAVFCRSAGTYAIVVGKDDKGGKRFRHVTVRLQSGEVRRVDKDACATIGVASNPHHQFRQLGKAGRSRWLNIRPTVRGLAMNACDHPHGGGRGKSKGNVHPVSPWGTPAKGGYKTRKKRNINKWVVHPRERNQGKRRSTS